MKRSLFLSILAASTLLWANVAVAEPEAPSQAGAVAQPEKPANPEMKPLLDAIKAQDWEKAAKEGESYIQKFADDSTGWSQLGIAYTNLNNFEKALSSFEKAAEHGDTSLENMRNRAVLSVSVKRPNALELMQETARNYPEDAYIQFLTGQTLASAKKDDEALVYFEKAVGLEPENLVYITNTSSFLGRKGNYLKAAELTTKAIESGTDASTLYINAVVYYFNAGMYEEAIKWADKGNLRKPDDLLTYHKGRCFLRLGRYDEAEQVLSQFKDSMYSGKLNYAMTRMMQGCDLARYASCSSSAPDPCCANEKEALELYAELGTVPENNKPDVLSLYYGLALALTGDTTSAEEMLHANLSSKAALRGEQLAAISVISWLNKDQNNALRLYHSAIANLPELQNDGNIDSFAVRHAWPSRAAELLKAVRAADKEAKEAKPQKAGCGCNLTHEASPVSLPVLLTFLLGCVALVLRRRHA